MWLYRGPNSPLLAVVRLQTRRAILGCYGISRLTAVRTVTVSQIANPRLIWRSAANRHVRLPWAAEGRASHLWLVIESRRVHLLLLSRRTQIASNGCPWVAGAVHSIPGCYCISRLAAGATLSVTSNDILGHYGIPRQIATPGRPWAAEGRGSHSGRVVTG